MSVLALRDVSLEFPIYSGGSRSLKKALIANTTKGNLGRDAFDRLTVMALRDITLELHDGDRLALIGANGAGKSTLLKVLAGIYKPTHGERLAVGSITALFSASAGFDMEATGRENIILRGMYLGVHPRDMRRRIPDISEFTELGDFLDMPMRTYSSGMIVRLAFAISTAVEPDILILDEWLGAGDARFLAKAQRRMSDFVSKSRILVLASHLAPLLSEWCTRAVLLETGRMVASGPVARVLDAYNAAPVPDVSQSA